MQKLKQIIGRATLSILLFSSIAFAAFSFAEGVVPLGHGLGTTDKEQQVVRVCKSGCVYSTVQGAIDSITDAAADKWYVIMLYPGVYTENVTLKNYVEIQGAGASGDGDIVLQATSGTVLTLPSTASSISNFVLKLLPTASGGKVLDATAGGDHRAFLMDVDAISATNGITATAIDLNCSSMLFARSSISYNMTGSAAGVNTHNIVNVNGSTTLIAATINNDIIIGDVDDNVNFINFNSTGQFVKQIFLNSVSFTNASYSGTFKQINITKNSNFKYISSVSGFISGNGTGTGYGLYLDTDTNDGVVQTGFNNFSITGFGSNHSFYAGTGDTITSQVDIVTAADDIEGDGTIDLLGTSEYGQVQITGGSSFPIDSTAEWHAFPSFSTGISSSGVTVSAGSTGAITSTANNGGVLRVTDAAHGLSTGDYITLTGMGDAAHDGITSVTVVDVDTFDADDIVYSSAADTGVWNEGSYIEAKHRGAYRIDWAVSGSAAAANQTAAFAVFNGITQVPGTKIRRKFATAGDVGAYAGTGVVFLERGERLWFGILNETSSSDLTISEGAFNTGKTS